MPKNIPGNNNNGNNNDTGNANNNANNNTFLMIVLVFCGKDSAFFSDMCHSAGKTLLRANPQVCPE